MIFKAGDIVCVSSIPTNREYALDPKDYEKLLGKRLIVRDASPNGSLKFYDYPYYYQSEHFTLDNLKEKLEALL